MTYKESVQRRITGDATELDRRRQLWHRIVSAHEQGGEDAIKSALTEQAESLTEEFEQLLKQLREKL